MDSHRDNCRQRPAASTRRSALIQALDDLTEHLRHRLPLPSTADVLGEIDAVRARRRLH